MTKRYDMTKKPGYYNDDTVMKTQEGKESKQGATPGHTPGPWVVHNNGLSIGIEGKIKGVVEVSLATTTLGGRANENRANARLIAAAPELLEVAIKLVTTCISIAEEVREIKQEEVFNLLLLPQAQQQVVSLTLLLLG